MNGDMKGAGVGGVQGLTSRSDVEEEAYSDDDDADSVAAADDDAGTARDACKSESGCGFAVEVHVDADGEFTRSVTIAGDTVTPASVVVALQRANAFAAAAVFSVSAPATDTVATRTLAPSSPRAAAVGTSEGEGAGTPS
jgi:hypothetical protein